MRTRIRAFFGVSLIAALAAIVLAARSSSIPLSLAQSSAAGPDARVAATSAGSVVNADTFRNIARAQMPMVVNIRTESRRATRDLSDFFDNDLLQRFFGSPEAPGGGPREQITEAAGTGFIIEKTGRILTNNHVVAGATKITVALYAAEGGDEDEYAARVVGHDPLTDSALIELTEKPKHDLPVATLGRSNSVQPGDWVMAIGNPFNLAHTVTVGVISAIGRPFPVSEGHWQNVLQTDAAINPGNSGGPLLNVKGEVIGINAAILTDGSQGNVGVGFAIPIDAVHDLLPQLSNGTITRGRIGVQMTAVPKELVQPLGLKDTNGALVRTVERDGPAAKAGIEPGDVIVRYNNQIVDKEHDLVAMVAGTKPGTSVPIEIVRDGKNSTVRVTVATLDVEGDETQSGTASSDAGFGLALADVDQQLRKRLDVPNGKGGAVVQRVEPGSAARRAGIRPGDVIFEVNRQPVDSAGKTVAALQKVPKSDAAFVLLWREGQEVFVTLPPR
ncbi:MAG TPA: trypsin-like peptidase domain-containing protein [Vicinamibacterales bacterium]|jgi:serine protease Do